MLYYYIVYLRCISNIVTKLRFVGATQMWKTNNRSIILFIFSIIILMCLNLEEAKAQEGISIETFKPSSSTNSIYELTLTKPKEHLKWSVGGLFSYAHKPVFRKRQSLDDNNQETTTTDYPVLMRTTADLYAALGLFDIIELGLAIPVIIYQKSDDEIESQNNGVQSSGLGDIRVEAKGRFYNKSNIGIGAGLTITIPTGHYISDQAYLGATYPTLEPKFLIDYDKGPLLLALNLGFITRFGSPEIGGTTQTHAVTANAGAGYDILDFDEPGGIRIALEVNSEFGFNTMSIPAEALVGVKYRTKNDIIVQGGAGPGLTRGIGTPVFRIFAGIAFDAVRRNCPAGPEDIDGFEDDDKCIDPDNDKDGILDVNDKCPDEAEDKDDFKDEDGCPDTDNDGDLIPDALDVDQYEDDDGCPEEGPGKPTVKITDSQLLISSKVYFDYDKDTIKEVSHPILDAVAEALIANPYIKKIRIDGHTDNEGTTEYNMDLSKRRAKAVRNYLVEKGVEKVRLSYKGFGFSSPKASNDSEEGKAINRRVEFKIVSGKIEE